MNPEMAYLLGMILGNGEIQRGHTETTVTIDIPHKNIKDDAGRDVRVYVKASVTDIRGIIEPLVSNTLTMTETNRSTVISFTKNNLDYTMREIMRYIDNGVHHSSMTMNDRLRTISITEKIELLRGFADVTGYIRKSNLAYGQKGAHRVYLEVPGNWQMVIDICNLLKDVDVPVQTIDFGHPNFRDSNLKKYNAGKPNYWKKEHQIKIWANEFLTVGFNIEHKQKALEEYATELLNSFGDNSGTHEYYWEKSRRSGRQKPLHPSESDPSLPASIRGKHYNKWQDLARELGYHE